MPSIKLIQILETFSPKEWKKFHSFIQSPYFNTNPRLVTMVSLLRQAAPDFEHPSLEKEALFREMYGEEAPYNEQQVYDHISFLMRHLETFLAFGEWEEDPSGQQLMLLKALTQRDLDDQFDRVYKKVDKNLRKSKIRNVKYQLDQFLLFQEGFLHDAKKQQRSKGESLHQTLAQLDIYYLIAKLRFSCELLNRRNILNVSHESEMLDEIRLFLEKEENPYRDHPILSIYRQVFFLLSDFEEEAHYRSLVALLDDYSHFFPVDEAGGLYTYVLNYCTKKINSGRKEFIKEAFELNKKLLEKQIIPEAGVLDHSKYKNIVTVGLILKEYDWVKDFLEDYKEYVTEEVREAAYHYNLANYYFSQKEYRKAMRTLIYLDIDDVYYNLSAKKLLLKAYYELDEEDALETLISTFYTYIKRNKTISKYHFETYSNFLRFVRKADKLRQKRVLLDEESFAKQAKDLLTQIENATHLNDNWIRGKVSEMIPKVVV